MSTMRLQTFTPLEELKHLCLGGEPYPPSIREEPTDALVAKLGFASTMQFQYMRFEQICRQSSTCGVSLNEQTSDI